MKREMILKSANGPSGLSMCPTNKYVLEFESKSICDNKNQIIYNVVAEKLKHDLRENLTIEQLMNLYE